MTDRMRFTEVGRAVAHATIALTIAAATCLALRPQIRGMFDVLPTGPRA